MHQKAERARIGVRNVEALVPHPDGSTRVRLWDVEVRGFGVRVSKQKRKTYCVKYERCGKDQTYTIGEHGSPWTPHTARARAKEILAQVARGEDPAEIKREDRSALTVSALIELWLRDGPISRPKKRKTSWDTDASRLRKHAAPLIGRLLAREVKRKDIEWMQAEIARGATGDKAKRKGRGQVQAKGGPGPAANTVQCVSAMYGWALDMEYVEHNPCMRVKKASRPKRVRMLSADETRRLLAAMKALEEGGANRVHMAILRLLLLTGARKNEIARLQWDEIDWERRCIVLPLERSKTGERDPIRLATPAIAILEKQLGMRNPTNPFVFPNQHGRAGPASAPDMTWKKVRIRAELTNFRMHDLRHNAASVAVNENVSLFLTGKLLGHKSSITTERYAHAADDPVHRAAEAVAARILAHAGHVMPVAPAAPVAEKARRLPVPIASFAISSLSICSTAPTATRVRVQSDEDALTLNNGA